MDDISEEVETNNIQVPLSALKDLSNSIVRFDFDGQKGTGFFIKFKIKGQQLFTLFTCFHVIGQDFVNSKKTIIFYYGEKKNEIKKYIKLDINERFIKCFEKPKDVTIIEIIESDNIPKEIYLDPDLNYKNNGFNDYLNKKLYLAGFPRAEDIYMDYQNEVFVSSGKITDMIDNYAFEHDLDTRKGSSGSPICLINNKCVIGIHTSGNSKKPFNKGTFIGIILDELEKEYQKIKKLIIKTEEEESFEFYHQLRYHNKINRKLFEDQHKRNVALGSLLAILEYIAYRFKNFEKKYDRYINKSIKHLSIENLKVHLEIESKSFIDVYNKYIDEKGSYWFPENVSKNSIIKEIFLWKEVVPLNFKIYYDNIIFLFCGKGYQIFFPKLPKLGNNQIDSLIRGNVINLGSEPVKDNFLKNNIFYNYLNLHNDFCDCDKCRNNIL